MIESAIPKKEWTTLPRPVREKVVQKMQVFLFVLVGLGFVSPQAAHAYLDPGSGSMLLQLVLGGLAGLAVIAKLYWQRLRGLFGLHSSQEASDSEMDSTSRTPSEPSDGPQESG